MTIIIDLQRYNLFYQLSLVTMVLLVSLRLLMWDVTYFSDRDIWLKIEKVSSLVMWVSLAVFLAALTLHHTTGWPQIH